MLLKNGKVLVDNNSDMDFKKTDIRIDDGIIIELAENLTPTPYEECIDLNGDYVLPGMVNSHYHSYTNILRGTSFGEPLELWSVDTVALGKILTETEMALSVSLGICEMLHAGVTACVDHLPHLATSYTAAKTYETTGFKSALAPMLHNIPDNKVLYKMDEVIPNNLEDNSFPTVEEYTHYYMNFIEKFHNPNGNLQVMVGVNSPQRADDKLLKAAYELSYKFNLPIHCHLLETRWQKISADQTISPVLKLEQFGLLGNRTSLAHCIWMNEDELDLIAKRKAIVVSNPTSNCFLGSGIFPSKEYLKRNIPIALGSDGVNCGTNNNMLDILRFFLLIQRSQEQDYRQWINVKEGFHMITKNSNRILGFHRPLGEIKANYSADLVVVNKNSILNILDNYLLNQIIFNSSLSVKHVLINGHFVMKDSKILKIDEENLKREICARKPYLQQDMLKALNSTKKEKNLYKSIYQSL